VNVVEKKKKKNSRKLASEVFNNDAEEKIAPEEECAKDLELVLEIPLNIKLLFSLKYPGCYWCG